MCLTLPQYVNPTKGQKLLMLLITKWFDYMCLHLCGVEPLLELYMKEVVGVEARFLKMEVGCGYMWGIVDLVIDFWNT
jgi:hypothetical protein